MLQRRPRCLSAASSHEEKLELPHNARLRHSRYCRTLLLQVIYGLFVPAEGHLRATFVVLKGAGGGDTRLDPRRRSSLSWGRSAEGRWRLKAANHLNCGTTDHKWPEDGDWKYTEWCQAAMHLSDGRITAEGTTTVLISRCLRRTHKNRCCLQSICIFPLGSSCVYMA